MTIRILLSAFCLIVAYSCTQKQAIKTEALPPADLASITYSDNDGSSFKSAVVVNNAKTQREGVAAEYHYIADRFGERGRDWFLVEQTVISHPEKVVDVIEIRLNNPEVHRVVFFDATQFILKN
jgi:hypothetical protein